MAAPTPASTPAFSGAVSVPGDLLGIVERLWCLDCCQRSAIRVVFNYNDAVGHVEYCTRCHGARVG